MDSLFTSLRKYRPRENTDPLENFVTEAFAWLLRKDDGLGLYLISAIAQMLADTDKSFSPPSDVIVWSTQENYDGYYPDMEAKWPGMAIVFEHKVNSKLHANQLENYREFHRRIDNDYRLILVTRHRAQHAQNPDLALCWFDIYALIKGYLETSEETSITWVINDFLQLLKSQGLGPAAPISHTSIWYYQEAMKLNTSTQQLMNNVIEHGWSIKKEYHCEVKSSEGVMGIQFNRIERKEPLEVSWKPGIFVGFVLDGTDHKIKHRLKDGLKMCLNISIQNSFHKTYSNWLEYKALVTELTEKALKSDREWLVYDHVNDKKSCNKWHPLYLECSMLDVFKGTETMEEQEKRFVEIAEDALSLLMSCVSFQSFENKLMNS